MELKYNWKKEKFDIRNCFNRTFMELKYRYLKPIADHSFEF